jgi:hypothetical protein
MVKPLMSIRRSNNARLLAACTPRPRRQLFELKKSVGWLRLSSARTVLSPYKEAQT